MFHPASAFCAAAEYLRDIACHQSNNKYGSLTKHYSIRLKTNHSPKPTTPPQTMSTAQDITTTEPIVEKEYKTSYGIGGAGNMREH